MNTAQCIHYARTVKREARSAARILHKEAKGRAHVVSLWRYVGLAAIAFAFFIGGAAPAVAALVVAASGQALLTQHTNAYALGLRLPLKLSDPTGNIVTNGKATFTLPKGYAMHHIIFHVQDGGVDMTVAQIKARIDSIVLKVGGKAVREWTPTSLDICNATNGAQYAMAAGYFTDYFSEPWRRTLEGEEKSGMGTQQVGDITYEIKFNGAAVAPSIEAYGVFETTDRPFRSYPFRHVRTYSGMPVINGAQQWPGNGVLREVGLFYDRIHFLSALVTSVRIEVNKNVKWEDIPRALLSEILAKRGLALQANTYSVVFSGTSQQLTDQLASFVDDGSGNLQIVNDLLLRWTGTGAGNSDVVTEQYQIFK